MNFIKPKTASTSSNEVKDAEERRRAQDERDAANPPPPPKAASPAAPAGSTATPPTSSKKPLSMTAGAIKAREFRQRHAKPKKAAQGSSSSSGGQGSSAGQPSEFENETHFVDARGRKRRRKTIRSIAAPSGKQGKKGSRTLSSTEKEIILQMYREMQQRSIGEVSYANVALELQRRHATLFGPGAPGLQHGASRQLVRAVVKRAAKGEISDGRGRPPAMPALLVAMIVVAFQAVIATRATLISAVMLQPIALGIIAASGHGHLLTEGRKKRGIFCCGLDVVRGILKDHGCRCVRPASDTRKLPSGWGQKRWDMVLRLAWKVFEHKIPTALVVNADHTGVMFHQVKGRMWITEEMARQKDKSVKGHGDKRQFTLLASSAANGEVLPHQVIVTGKTARSLPSVRDGKYKLSVNERNTKKRQSVCFILVAAAISAGKKAQAAAATALVTVQMVANIASFCTTANHWADDVTSKAYVKDVAVPYFKRTVEKLHRQDPQQCKPFGQQICILILDCWWGWLDAGFRGWVKTKFPWIQLIFVPAGCTPVAQPLDAGVIAKIKAILRRHYGRWVMSLVKQQLLSQSPPCSNPGAVEVPADVQTCKGNLCIWLSDAMAQLNSDHAGIVHCWAETMLLRAWEHATQVEAAQRKGELFTVTEQEVDAEAGDLGLPFVQDEGQDEWEQYINWGSDDVERE